MSDTAGTAKRTAGVLDWTLGDLVVSCVNDGYLTGSYEIVHGLPGDEAERLQEAAFRPGPPRLTVNTFLIRGRGAPILIDAGMGGLGGPTAGRLASGLAAAGVQAAEIETVLMTHLHSDHVGGLIDADGKAAFLEAEIVCADAEADHWLGSDALRRAPEARRPSVEQIQRCLAPYAGRVRRISTSEVRPGIDAVPLPGHTPGHTGFRLTSGAHSFLVWGDIVHLPALQFARPDVGVAFDIDGAQAASTRTRILEETASEGTLVAGMHLDFPALGHVARDGAGYRWVPEVWLGA